MTDTPLANVKFTLVDSTAKASEFMSWLGERRDVLGFDTETGGLKCHRDRLRLVQFGDMQRGWAIPWDGWGGVAVEALSKYDGELAAHNSKFDVGFLRRYAGWKAPWHKIRDTMTMSHISYPTWPHGLKPLSAMLVDPMAASAQRVLDEAMSTNKWTWDTVPITFEPYWVYAALDPVLTCHLDEQLKHDSLTTYRYVYDLEMSLVRIIHNMEYRGARVDLDYCYKTRLELQDYAARAKEWCHVVYGLENVNSAPQVIRVFESLGHVVTRWTEGGSKSADKYQLRLWIHDNGPGSELARTILAIRGAEKNTGPYFDNFINLADSNSMLHAAIWPQGTRTARMSITEPALQTLPKKDPVVRSAFVPREYALITCDYAQIEMRLLAHFSQDPGLIDAFVQADATGGDFFVNLANQIYQTTDVQKENDPRRQYTKNTAYAKAYGAGVTKMAQTVGVPYEVMDDVNTRFDLNFPSVKEFQKAVNYVGGQRLRETGEPYVVTPYGRRLACDRDKSYVLVNYLIQSHAAEMFKRAIVTMDAVGLGEYLTIPVHDEIVADVTEDVVDEAMYLIRDAMTDLTNYTVPITAEAVLIKDRWGSKYQKAQVEDVIS